MDRKPVQQIPQDIPAVFHDFFREAAVYDSSCSNRARVWYLEKDGGFYLKTAPKGNLQSEAEMTRFFHGKGLGAEVLGYESGSADWLLTRRVPGEDGIWQPHLEQPERLCDMMAEAMRMLHDTDPAGCPVNRRQFCLENARRVYEEKTYDASLFPDNWGYDSPEEAWAVIEESGKNLRCDTLIHGDFCLPNIMLADWRFSGFIDLDQAGLGDRHMDIFWCLWSLGFNLKTDRYRDRFLDAYGRDRISEDMLRLVAAIEVFA